MSCRRAAELITRALDGPLPLLPRLGLGLHTLLCRPCRRFRVQVAAIDDAVADYLAGPPREDDGPALPAAGKERLRLRLRHELDREGEPG